MDKQRNDAEREREFLEAFSIPYPYSPPKQFFSKKSDPDKLLILADPHEPYGNENVYRHALDACHDAGTVIVAGDLGDYYSKSRFRKVKHVSFKDEVRSVFYRMEWLSTHWREVKIMLGNHDNRPEKKIQDLMPTDMLILTEQNLLIRLACYFPNVEIVGQQLDGAGIWLSHIYQFGDIVFCHGEVSRKQNSAIMEFISRYLYLRTEMLNLKPYRILAQAHVHRDDKFSKGHERCFLLPTCSNPFSVGMEYIWAPTMKGEPPVCGYSIFYQHEGVTDYNRSHHVVLDD